VISPSHCPILSIIKPRNPATLASVERRILGLMIVDLIVPASVLIISPFTISLKLTKNLNLVKGKIGRFCQDNGKCLCIIGLQAKIFFGF